MTQTYAEAWPGGLALPSRRRIRRTVAIAGAAAMLALAVSWAAAARHTQASAPTQAADETPVAAWREIASPEHIYYLEAPAFADAPVDYTARRHPTGGREDVMSIGAMDGAKPAIRLRIVRRTEAAASPTPLFAALAHEAAAAGLSIGRSGLPEILPTRFGRFEVADLSLVKPDAGPTLPCSGFRLVADAPALSIAGLACGARTAPLTRADIGCLIERLDVAAVGNDRALADFFARAALARNPACIDAPAELKAQVETPTSPTGKPATQRKSLRRR